MSRLLKTATQAHATPSQPLRHRSILSITTKKALSDPEISPSKDRPIMPAEPTQGVGPRSGGARHDARI